MRISRIVLVAVALIAAGLAMYLALNSGGQPQPEEPQTVAVAVPHDQVLVAKADIGIGERLGPDNLVWQDWPQNALQPNYITVSATPQAIDQMKTTVARFELFKGEPIQPAKLVHSDQGYLSAVLDKGKRATTTIAELSPERRREEIARMLAGAEITAEARAAAERLIKAAG